MSHHNYAFGNAMAIVATLSAAGFPDIHNEHRRAKTPLYARSMRLNITLKISRSSWNGKTGPNKKTEELGFVRPATNESSGCIF